MQDSNDCHFDCHGSHMGGGTGSSFNAQGGGRRQEYADHCRLVGEVGKKGSEVLAARATAVAVAATTLMTAAQWLGSLGDGQSSCPICSPLPSVHIYWV